MTQRLQSIKFFLLFALLGSAPLQFAQAYFEGNHRYDGQSIVNGIDFRVYKSFPEKWRLVTVRSSEAPKRISVTYANPPAFAHLLKLKSGKSSSAYPDGAAFGLVLFSTEADSRLATSSRPSEMREYQLMLRNRDKFKSTEGWGYARFNSKGLSFNEEPLVQAVSCNACHTLAQKENFVFSQLAPFAVSAETRAEKTEKKNP
ncbi:hypothetical protein BH10BDE1_BH10BDE1_34940 [soil metagenome]